MRTKILLSRAYISGTMKILGISILRLNEDLKEALMLVQATKLDDGLQRGSVKE